MRHSPIVTANLWFDRPVLELPFVGLPGRTFQWAFDRCQLTPGESTCVSLVCSGADRVADLSNEAIVAGAHSDLAAALPGVRRVRLLRGAAIRERRATFSLAAGEPLRPATGTAVPGFFLAGDWIDTGLPATIESAVISGHRAARAALARVRHLPRRWPPGSERHLPAASPPAPSPAAMRSSLAHYQEIALKGQNRPWFLRHLAHNLRDALAGLDVGEVRLPMGRIEIALGEGTDIDEARRRLRTTCGLANFAVAGTAPPDVAAITEAVLRDLPRTRVVPSFRVEVKRAHKQFPVVVAGSRARDRQPHPGRNRLEGRPVRSGIRGLGRDRARAGLLLLRQGAGRRRPAGGDGRARAGPAVGRHRLAGSGGRMIRRGCHATFVHFHGQPFTSRASIDKVRELVRVLAPYQLGAHVMFVAFGELQRQVTHDRTGGDARGRLPPADDADCRAALAAKVHAHTLVTGDVVGQVASQTLDNLAVVDASTSLLTVRPLVGMDKEEITAEAVRLGSYPISILPDEDCCTLFTPRHPTTRARLAEVEAAEAELADRRDGARRRPPIPEIERVQWPVLESSWLLEQPRGHPAWSSSPSPTLPPRLPAPPPSAAIASPSPARRPRISWTGWPTPPPSAPAPR